MWNVSAGVVAIGLAVAGCAPHAHPHEERSGKYQIDFGTHYSAEVEVKQGPVSSNRCVGRVDIRGYDHTRLHGWYVGEPSFEPCEMRGFKLGGVYEPYLYGYRPFSVICKRGEDGLGVLTFYENRY